MPELSVLMPALNASATIAAAVRSTFKAMPKDAELVVLDDGSTDDTAEVAQSAADAVGRGAELRILRNETPGGVGNGLNRLLAESDSKLVARMDADDESLPWRFSICRGAINAGDDFVFTQVVKKSGKKIRPNLPIPIPPRDFALELLLTNPVAHSAMLAKREAMDALGGYRQVPAEDYDMWMRAATRDLRLRRLARWGLIYKTHPHQLTASDGWFGKSWTNPEQAQAFADMSEHLTGEPLRRLVAIVGLDTSDRSYELARFRSAVSEAISSSRGLHGFLLRRRLAERLSWLERAAKDREEALRRRRDER